MELVPEDELDRRDQRPDGHLYPTIIGPEHGEHERRDGEERRQERQTSLVAGLLRVALDDALSLVTLLDDGGRVADPLDGTGEDGEVDSRRDVDAGFLARKVDESLFDTLLLAEDPLDPQRA